MKQEIKSYVRRLRKDRLKAIVDQVGRFDFCCLFLCVLIALQEKARIAELESKALKEKALAKLRAREEKLQRLQNEKRRCM